MINLNNQTTRYNRSEMLLLCGFCLIVFLLPATKSPALIAGGLTILIWIFSGRFAKDYKIWLGQVWVKPVLLFVLLPWLGLIWTDDPKKGIDFAEKTYYWLLAFAVCSISHKRAVYIIWAFITGLSLNVVVAILQYAGVFPYLKEEFATGLLTGFNPYISYSLILVFGMLIISFHFRNTSQKWQKIFIIALITSYIFNLSIIHGRSGYIAFILLSPLVIYNLVGKKHFVKIIIAAVLITGMFLLSPTVQYRINLVKEEISLYYQGQKNTSVGLRLHMWDGALKIFADNPLIGAGTGSFEKSLKKYNPDPSLPHIDQPHNSFLYMAASFGIIGVFSILWLFAVFLKKGWKHRDNILGYSMLMFGIILIIGSMTDTQILSRITGILFAIFMGMRVKDDES